jgi:zinc transport system permease protein
MEAEQMINAIIEYTFMQNALLAAIFASIVCGVIGTIVIEKKLVMMSGGIAHTSFGGIGLGYLIGIEPIIGALIFSILSALGIAKINKKWKGNSDIAIGLFWSVGMALGLLFIRYTPGYKPDMSSYLFGDILAVSKTGIIMMIGITILILFFIFTLFNIIKAYIFDEEYCRILKLPVDLIEYILYIMIALTTVILIKVVGLILIIALLTVPPAIIKMYSYSFKKIMIFSVFLGMVLCILGLWISYEMKIPSGASIIFTLALAYIISLIVLKIKPRI